MDRINYKLAIFYVANCKRFPEGTYRWCVPGRIVYIGGDQWLCSWENRLSIVIILRSDGIWKKKPGLTMQNVENQWCHVRKMIHKMASKMVFLIMPNPRNIHGDIIKKNKWTIVDILWYTVRQTSMSQPLKKTHGQDFMPCSLWATTIARRRGVPMSLKGPLLLKTDSGWCGCKMAAKWFSNFETLTFSSW